MSSPQPSATLSSVPPTNHTCWHRQRTGSQEARLKETVNELNAAHIELIEAAKQFEQATKSFNEERASFTRSRQSTCAETHATTAPDPPIDWNALLADLEADIKALNPGEAVDNATQTIKPEMEETAKGDSQGSVNEGTG